MSNQYQRLCKFDNWLPKATLDELNEVKQSLMNKVYPTNFEMLMSRLIQREIQKKMKNRLYVRKHREIALTYCTVCNAKLVHKPAIHIKKQFFAEKVGCSNCNYVQVIGY